MDVYFNNLPSRGLVLIALIIVGSTLWYTNKLANQFKIEEKKKVALWAKATKELSDINNLNYDIMSYLSIDDNQIVQQSIEKLAWALELQKGN